MTSTNLQVRDAEINDLSWIASLVRGSFDAPLLPYLVAAQSGIVDWWQVVLTHPASFPTTRFLVAVTDGGRPLGYAELKELDATTGFLSYIAVAPEARGRGVASGLLSAYFADAPHLTAMELDVFADNAPARTLYDRLGFAERSAARWWSAPLATSSRTRPDSAPVADLHAVLARHRAYGFTDLVSDPAGSAARFGVLGERVLRCFTADTFDDARAQEPARAVFPGLTHRFAVLPADQQPGVPDAQQLVSSLRMRSDRITDLLETP